MTKKVASVHVVNSSKLALHLGGVAMKTLLCLTAWRESSRNRHDHDLFPSKFLGRIIRLRHPARCWRGICVEVAAHVST